jgi:methylenetetrahydrofolate reductase (NADPH)
LTAQLVTELITNGSIECTLGDAPKIAQAAGLLPHGMDVYVTALPHQSLRDTLTGLRQIRSAGLYPVPHLAARRVPSRAALREFLERAALECDVHRVFVIGGDDHQIHGPYPDAEALLRDGVLREAGIREVGIAGYPEGHPRVDADTLHASFHRKRALLHAQGLGLFVLTQFSFAPARIVEYCAGLARSARDVPVYVGMAGPTHPSALLRYAQRCGVSASLRALQGMGFGAARLVSRTDPIEQLQTLARYCAPRIDCNIVGAHFFSFGAFSRTAAWLNAVVAERHPAGAAAIA